VKRTTAAIAFMLFSLIILLPLTLNIKTTSAQGTNYTITSVDHQVEVMYSGHIVIRDTIHVSGQITGGFLIGFPYKYGAGVLKAIAYDANNVFPMNLGVQLENRVGFYGAEITFPQGSPQVFTVVFVLSNTFMSEVQNIFVSADSKMYSLDFPAYPSFALDVAKCNVTIVLPETPSSITISKTDGGVDTTNYVKDNLPAFTYSPATATFQQTIGSLQIINMKELNRQITFSPAGGVTSSDSYRVTNNQTDTIGSITLGLPLNATNIIARDEFGRILTTDILGSSGNTLLVNVTLVSTLTSGESSLLTADYSLPSPSSGQTTHFTFNFVLFPDFDYYVDKATITFIPPEGARFVTPTISELDSSSSLSREIFQESLSITRTGVSYVGYSVPSEDVLQVTYDYNPLWLSFRPTSWMWVIAVICSAIIIVWKRPKPSAPARIVAPKASVGLTPDHVRAFSEAYEDKNRLASELKSLESRAQKGRIPRRQYKVQRRTLEVRLDGLSKNISGLKGIFRSAGGVYADLVRQLDFAETELVEVETNIRTIEARKNRGELSLEAYKKLLADYQRRKEKAETTVNGILLRLREELH
jgi:hypothetical protein